MTSMVWVWASVLGSLGVIALYLAFRLPMQRWPRVIAVAAGAAFVSVLMGETGAATAILITGMIMGIASAAATRK